MTHDLSDPRLECHFFRGSAKAIVCLRGQLIAQTVGGLVGLSPKLGDPRFIELDLSDLATIDEEGVQALRFLERRLTGKGGLFVVSFPKPAVRRLLSQGGIRSLLAPSFPSRRVTGVTFLAGLEPDAPRAG